MMKRMMPGLMLTVILILMLPSPASAASAEQQYEEALSSANLEKYPQRHKRLAEWCFENGLKTKGDHHSREYRLYLYGKKRARIKGAPTLKDLAALQKEAEKLDLPELERDLRQQWVAMSLAERRAALAEDDVAGLSELLAWAQEQAAVGAVRELAAAVIALDADHREAHLALGHIEHEGGFLDPWEALVQQGGLKDVTVRYRIHRQLAERVVAEQAFDPDPLAGQDMVVAGGWRFPTVYDLRIALADGLSDDKGRYFCHCPANYDAATKTPLIVYLHGGGSGGVEASIHSASNNIANLRRSFPDKPHIVISPVLRVHSINSWNVQVNQVDVIDAIRDACRRFNIDRERIYLSGASMGGQGTARLSWVVPECFAAFAPRAGAYWNKHAVPDLTGKPFLILHGKKDAGFRNKSMKVFKDKIEKAGADVRLHEFDAGHQLPEEAVVMTYAFFEQHKNDFAPDLLLVRRIITETVTEKPHRGK